MTNRRVILADRAPQAAIAGRWLLVALGTLVLCSCRTNTFNLREAITDNTVQPSSRAVVAVVDDRCGPPLTNPCDNSSGLASCPVPPGWSPNQPVRRQPRDEYLCDGGDNLTPAQVNRHWEAYGVEAEDTLAHFDTLNGRIEVAASNRVCIYAPRFAAVRKVSGFRQNERLVAPSKVQENLHPHRYDETAIATLVKQPESTVRGVSATVAQGLQDRQPGRRVEQIESLMGTRDRVALIENLGIIRTGVFEASEAAVVDQGIQAAVAWTTTAAVQLMIDSKQAFMTKAAANGHVCYTYQMPPGKPRMRVVKLASPRQAQPGEIVEFTIRFDNVGDEPVGNVTILDNLTTRLEYVDLSQTCTRDALFSSEPNDGDSLKLMWDIQQPLETSEGGVIRFQCRVR